MVVSSPAFAADTISEAQDAIKQKAQLQETENPQGNPKETDAPANTTETVEQLLTKVTQLQNTISQQQEKIKAFNQQVKLNSEQKVLTREPMKFEVFSGLLLAVAALVLGAVGIGIAVLSFIGYNELINKGVEKATTVATQVSEKVTEETISEEVEREVTNKIDQLIIDGTFDNVITERVEQYIYRGIGVVSEHSGNDDNEEEPEAGNNE
jgi:hypothetical protein